jgi:DNA gyrase/topoisomerase IV subunit B
VESLIVSRVVEDDANDGGVRKNVTFRHDGGIKELVKVLCEGKVPLGVDDKASTQGEKKSSRSSAKKQVPEDADIIFVDEDRKGINVQVAMRWSSDHYVDALTGFANGIRTPDGGSHLDGLKAAITKTVNNYAKKVKP